MEKINGAPGGTPPVGAKIQFAFFSTTVSQLITLLTVDLFSYFFQTQVPPQPSELPTPKQVHVCEIELGLSAAKSWLIQTWPAESKANPQLTCRSECIRTIRMDASAYLASGVRFRSPE